MDLIIGDPGCGKGYFSENYGFLGNKDKPFWQELMGSQIINSDILKKIDYSNNKIMYVYRDIRVTFLIQLIWISSEKYKKEFPDKPFHIDTSFILKYGRHLKEISTLNHIDFLKEKGVYVLKFEDYLLKGPETLENISKFFNKKLSYVDNSYNQYLSLGDIIKVRKWLYDKNMYHFNGFLTAMQSHYQDIIEKLRYPTQLTLETILKEK